MATAPIIWADSFMGYASADADSIYPSGKFHAGITIDNGGGRGARGSVTFGFSSTGGYGIDFGTTYTTWIFSFALKPSSGEALQLYLGSDDSRLILSGSSTNGMYSPGSFRFPTVNAWTHVAIRVFCDSSAGTYDVWYDESLIYHATGQNTGSATRVYRLGTSGNMKVSDFIIQASNTGTDEPIGDRAVQWVPVTADGAHGDWTPLSGTDHFAMVDDATPDGDTSYISSGTADDRDTFTHDDLPAATAAVDAVVPKMWARKTDAGSRTIAPTFRIGGTDYDGDAQVLGTSYVQLYQVYEQSPATSSAWSVTELNGAEAGVKVTA